MEEINFDVQHIEALLATSFNNSSSNDEVSGNELFRAADFKTTLRNILYAYITFDPDLGYCNGMCSLVGFMLWWLRDINPSQSEVEQRVFFLLLVLFRHYSVETLYGIGADNDSNTGVSTNNKILKKFQTLFAKEMPLLNRHFINEDLDFEAIYSSWFKNLLTEFELMPPSTVARFWDIFFTEGWDSFMHSIIKILRLVEDDLLQLPMEGIMVYLRTLRQQRPEIYYVDENVLFDPK